MSITITPRFFEDVLVQVGQEVAVYSGHDWQLTFIAEIDSELRRLRCLSARYVPTYRDQQTTHEERAQLLAVHSFWYNCDGLVLSPATWKPLKRCTREVNIWEAGQIYLLTDEVRATMRQAQKRRRLNFLTSHQLYWAIQKDWKGETDEERLDFVLAMLNRGLEELTTRFGENGTPYHS